jgi:large subunit ribosomal protein L17
MRHQRKTVKLGRSQSHRDALLANQTISLIEHSRIKTTLAKAKAVRPFAEKMVTLGKENTLHARRTALSYLRHNEGAVKRLFEEVAPRCATRQGGYCRIIKLGPRNSDSAPMAFLEWVDAAGAEVTTATPAAAENPKRTRKPASKKEESDQGGAAEKKPARKPRAKKTEDEEKAAE